MFLRLFKRLMARRQEEAPKKSPATITICKNCGRQLPDNTPEAMIKHRVDAGHKLFDEVAMG